jgi:hypothetical protein
MTLCDVTHKQKEVPKYWGHLYEGYAFSTRDSASPVRNFHLLLLLLHLFFAISTDIISEQTTT